MTLKRLPWFELSILLIVVLIGWAEFRLLSLESEMVQDSDRLSTMEYLANRQEQKVKRMELEIRDAQKVFDELREAFRGELKELHASRMRDALTLPITDRLQDEYFAIADVVQRNVSQLQTALKESDLVNGRTVIPAGKDHPELAALQQGSQEFNSWVLKEKDRVESERLQSRSQELKAKLDKEQFNLDGRSVRITNDLRTLLNEIARCHSNYWNEAQQMIIDVRKNVAGDAIRKRAENAAGSVTQLSELGAQARSDGNAVKNFIDAQLQSEPNRRVERQEQALKAFLATGAQFESNRLERLRAEPLSGPVTPPSDGKVTPVRYVLYSLLLAQVAIGVYLAIAIYRRTVVATLRLKLVESDTIIEQQNKLQHFGELAAGLAHEIRNPLTAISARLYTLQKSQAEGSPEYHDASVIRNEIRRLDRIVQDFRSLARPAEPKLITMSAAPLLKETHELLAPAFETQSVQLELGQIAEGQFRGDHGQLKQVLINLIQNAAESMEGKGGPVILRARTDKAKLKGRETDAMIIEVEDSGPGIPPDVQERLFDPFFSTKERGTGLGLAIAARIVDRHDGALTFDTHLNHGTTFGIVLPLHAKPT